MLDPLGVRIATLAAIAAVGAPTVLAYNVAPSSTFLNQALSFGLWGGLVLASCRSASGVRLPAAVAWPPTAALTCLALAAAWAAVAGALPAPLAWSALATLVATVVVLTSGASSARGAFTAFAWAWLVAGLAGTLIAIVQVFFPDAADGDWIAHSSIAGRAVGNLRQPNHLSSVLLWALVASVALLELQHLAWRWVSALAAMLVFALVLTASRTGLLSVLLLASWGLVDRRLSPRARGLLIAAPVVYGLAWQAMSLWGQLGENRFGGEARLAETDISGSRFGIWGNALDLIRAHPWFGVGWGEFNFAWSLTPFPGRPVAFFDHTHNLLLQFAVELGVPLALLVIGLLLWGLARVAIGARRAGGDDGVMLRSGLVMLLMIGLHSMLEYPLWYAYFLLPTAWLWGHALALAAAQRAPVAPTGRCSPGLVVGGLALVAGAVFSVWDYQRVVVIFGAPEGAPPLEQRIAEGRRSVFFAHHADYAAATTGIGVGDDALAPFRSASHYLLDTRLMMAWAQALHREGQEDKARHVAQRLREFRNPLSDELFEACTAASLPQPFQCRLPLQAVPWREFTR